MQSHRPGTTTFRVRDAKKLLAGAAFLALAAISLPADAQQGFGQQPTGQAGGGQAGGGRQGAGQGGNAAGIGAGMQQIGQSPADVFTGVDRGGAVGAGGAASTPGANPNVGGAGRGRQGGGRAGGIGGMGGIGGLGGMGGLGGLFGSAFGGQGAGQGQQAVRTRLRSGVEVQSVAPAAIQSQVRQRLSSLPVGERLNGVEITMDGRTAILTGQVESEQRRRMSELLIRLEPGVSRIDNRLTVGPANAP